MKGAILNTSVDLPEIEDFGPRLDAINESFKNAAEILEKKRCLVPASFRDLEWRKLSCGWRFCSKDRPVLELPIADRLKLIRQLPGLMKATENEMRALFEGDSQS